MKKYLIAMYWADHFDIMKKVDMDEKYDEYEKRLVKMLEKEFPEMTFEIDWQD